jgi:hypothetical protein
MEEMETAVRWRGSKSRCASVEKSTSGRKGPRPEGIIKR